MNNGSVLLVDDQPHILRIMRLGLERNGYQVEVAYNGVQALEKLRRHAFDVLVTDVQMPQMDGRALCETVRRDLAPAVALILVVTARTDVIVEDWPGRLAGTEVLEKPLSMRRLLARLESHFACAAAPAEGAP